MVKKIFILLFVLAVLITGYLSFRKLNYWDRSVMIFRYDSSQQFPRGRGARAFGESERREGTSRPEFSQGRQREEDLNVPDSLRRRTDGRGQRNINRIRPGSDTLNFIRGERNPDFTERGEFSGRLRAGNENGGRNFRRGKAVNLNMVLYYGAVFALFTLLMVYLEKVYRLIFKQKKLSQENSELII